MKKLFFIALTCILSLQFANAQNSKSDARPVVQGEKPKLVPVKTAVKPVPVNTSRQEATKQAPRNASAKEATTSVTKPAPKAEAQQAKPVTKKDGTPDKRYKANQNLKKDGTPDKRFKENKSTGAKKN